jgi:hypothetical protein
MMSSEGSSHWQYCLYSNDARENSHGGEVVLFFVTFPHGPNGVSGKEFHGCLTT